MSSFPLLAAEEEPNPLLPHVSEVILVGVVFVVLYLLVRKFVVPSFEKTFAARRDAIEGGIARAEQAQAEAAAALANYQAQLADARGEAGQIREQARAEAQRIVEDLRAQAQAESGRIVARYLDLNPNGSLDDIAGICNEAGNVVGLMPHPEHAAESLTGPSTDGLGFFTSIVKRLVNA